MTLDDAKVLITREFTENRIPGWCPIEKALELMDLIKAVRPKTAMETGVFGGRSLIPMALAMKVLGCGKVIAVDPWTAEAGKEGYTGVNAEWWGKQNMEAIYQGFMANIQRLNLTDVIEVRREKSLETALPSVIDLWHCDSNHNEMAIAEVKRFSPNVPVAGVVICDDLGWHNDGVLHVAQAVQWLLMHDFKEMWRRKLPAGDEWGIFQKLESCI